jgi:hypothetical protein
MVTGTRARSYEEMVDALAEEGLPALQDKLSALTPQEWQRPTRLQPPEPGKPPWTVLQLAAHFDVFMGLTMGLVAEPHSAQPVVDRASFYISVSDRSKVSPVIYQYIIDHAGGHTPATIVDKVGETFTQALEAIKTTPPDTIGPGFFGPIRLDEFVATRLVETQVHRMDLTNALGASPLHMPRTTVMAAEVLDEVLARRAVPRRAVPALLTLGLLLCIAWLLASGRLDHLRHRPADLTAAPATITIPAIEVKASIVGIGLQADGAMQLPEPDQVGWYRLGPRPGAPGPAVLIGPVDTPTDPAVFYRLGELRPGDEILIGHRGGATSRFLVRRLERHPKTAQPTRRIWTTARKPLLCLITDGGSFDHATGHYRDNLIVYASPTGN